MARVRGPNGEHVSRTFIKNAAVLAPLLLSALRGGGGLINGGRTCVENSHQHAAVWVFWPLAGLV